MEQQNKKRKSKFALLLVTENEEGIMKQRHINSGIVEVAAIVLFLMIVGVICRFIYDSITLKDARSQLVDQLVTINNLTDENEALSVENSTLSNKVTVLSVDADTEYGTKIVVDHGNGYCSVYRNNGTALVKAGEELGKGYILFTIEEDNQKLGYQIMKDDAYIDPMSMIDING